MIVDITGLIDGIRAALGTGDMEVAETGLMQLHPDVLESLEARMVTDHGEAVLPLQYAHGLRQVDVEADASLAENELAITYSGSRVVSTWK